MLLGEYLMVAWEDLVFGQGSYGKPYVKWPVTDLCFNQSDSGDLAVFAFAAGCQVGVDVEEVRPVPDIEDLAADTFCSAELAALLSLPRSLRREAFFAAWTRKEAYIKAVGAGLHCPLDSFQVSLLPDEEARILTIGNDAAAAESWCMCAFDPDEGYSGALAYPGPRRVTRMISTVEAGELLSVKASI
jgi:4'-phosphopantetheinyl transferase